MALISGRPDGRLAQYIYPDGLGGVIDYRLPAKDMGSKEEAAKVFQKVVNGTYRGLEKLTYTHINTSAETGSATGVIFTKPMPQGLTGKGTLTGIASDGSIVGVRSIKSINYTLNAVDWDGALVRPSGGWYVVTLETNISVSGNFTMTDVIGSPAEILKVDALKNGWLGSWAGVSKSGGAAVIASRKNTLTSPLINGVVVSSDQGSTWSTGSTQASNTLNTVTATYATTEVRIVNYQAFAKQTKPSVNKPVLNGSEGLGDVVALEDSRSELGATFVGGLIGKVPTCSSAGKRYSTLYLQSVQVWHPDGGLQTAAGYEPTHVPVDLVAPNNSSPAVKALWHQTVDNKQVGLNFLWNELVWNSTASSWGDDSTIRIIADTGTYNNLNGDSCLYGASKLAMSYGYIEG